LHWRISLEHLEQGLSEIGGFPYEPGQRRSDGPTLFIKGEKSKYINRKSAAVCQEYFPNMKLEEVAGVGHWGTSPCFACATLTIAQYTQRSPPISSGSL
jgi:pimeloyl-ACP methyl ester carboxylesterase